MNFKYIEMKGKYKKELAEFRQIVQRTILRDSYWREKWSRYIDRIEEENFVAAEPDKEAAKIRFYFVALLRFKILEWVMRMADSDNKMDLVKIKNLKIG